MINLIKNILIILVLLFMFGNLCFNRGYKYGIKEGYKIGHIDGKNFGFNNAIDSITKKLNVKNIGGTTSNCYMFEIN